MLKTINNTLDTVLETSWNHKLITRWCDSVKVGGWHLSWPWILPSNIASRRKKVDSFFSFGIFYTVKKGKHMTGHMAGHIEKKWSFQHLPKNYGTKDSHQTIQVGLTQTWLPPPVGENFNPITCHISGFWRNSDLWGLITIFHLVGGFNHLEKYESQWEGLSHIWNGKQNMFETTNQSWFHHVFFMLYQAFSAVQSPQPPIDGVWIWPWPSRSPVLQPGSPVARRFHQP